MSCWPRSRCSVSVTVAVCRAVPAEPSVREICAGSLTHGPAWVLAPRDRLAHHAVVLALAPVVPEAGLFEEAAGAVVQERCRDLLPVGVLRVRLHYSTACLGDQVERTAKRDACHSLAPVVLVDEEAGKPIIGQLAKARFLLLAVVDVRQFLRRAVLAPGHRDFTVER
jgi:hypothetical protein